MLEVNKKIHRYLCENKGSIAESIINKLFELQPQFARLGGISAYEKYKLGTYHLISHLAEAIAQDEPILFIKSVEWAKVMLKSIGFDVKALETNLLCTKIVAGQMLPASEHVIIESFIDAALLETKNDLVDIPSFIIDANPYAKLAEAYLGCILRGEKQKAMELVFGAVENGTSINDVYLNILQPTQYEIGRLWQLNRVSVAEEHYVSAISQVIMSQLYPQLFLKNRKANGLRFLATCVQDELHEMGIRMVADFLEQEGWDTHYLGANMPEEGIVKAALRINPDVIAISTTLTVNISKAENLIYRIKKASGLDKPKIIVGGYPFNFAPNLWRNIEADGCSIDAKEAVALCQQLMQKDGAL